MGRHPYTLLDVFTDTPLAGNGLAVVHDADGLDEETMLRFARETRLSETTFVQTPVVPEADYRTRIFMMGGEIPFAGHPSLGAAVAVASARGEERARYVQQTGAGLQPIEVRRERGQWVASMRQQPPETIGGLDATEALAAVGLPAAAAHPELPPLIVSTGVPQAIVPVAEERWLERAEPAYERIAALIEPAGALVLYLVAPGERGRARARGFTGSAETGEDPATGSAAGPLCAYLHAQLGWESVEVLQGFEMGRPSRLEARISDGAVEVSGGVVILVEGTLTL